MLVFRLSKWPKFVAMTSVILSLATSGATAMYPGGGGGCQPVTVTETFRIWSTSPISSAGSLVFNGATFTSGQSTSIAAGCSQTYSIGPGSIPSNGVWWGWVADKGYFDYSLQQNTLFHPALESGTITMVLDYTGAVPRSHWAGVVEHGAGPYLSATGRFAIPPMTYQAGGPTTEWFAIWVGLGGFVSDNGFWQAGIIAHVTGSTTTYTAFYENIPPDRSPHEQSFAAAVGDNIQSSVQAWPNNGTGCFTVVDLDRANVRWASCIGGVYPDGWTAEWIGEGDIGGKGPGGFLFQFYSLSSNLHSSCGGDELLVVRELTDGGSFYWANEVNGNGWYFTIHS